MFSSAEPKRSLDAGGLPVEEANQREGDPDRRSERLGRQYLVDCYPGQLRLLIVQPATCVSFVHSKSIPRPNVPPESAWESSRSSALQAAQRHRNTL